MRQILSVILSIVMIFSVCCFTLPASAAPEGTPIKTAKEFATMDPAGTYYLANDITIEASYVNSFVGTFDGNGKTVTTTVPLFLSLDGNVKNLTIKGNIVITVAPEEHKAEGWAGALANIAGLYASATITNVCNKAPLTSAVAGLGGLVGMVINDSEYSVTFTNCENYGNIVCSVDSSSKDCGGIVGQYDGVNVAEQRMKFINCTNHGTINTCGRPGGIVGYANSSTYFEGCINNGDILATHNYCGGIAGRLDGDSGYNYYLLENCVNNGNVIVYQSQGAGMVGYCGGFEELIYRNCTNNGNIVGNDANQITVTLGGIHGNNYKNAKKLVFENCVNNGDIGTTEWPANINSGGIAGGTNGTSILFTGCVNNGNIKANNNCGGIAGNSNTNAAATLPMSVTITKCMNYGNVTGVKGYAAGILGYSYAAYNYGASITYCVTTGDISCQTGTCSGLIGYINCGWVDAKIEHNIIGGSLKGQVATPVVDGATVTARTMYSYTNANGKVQYFYAPTTGTLSIQNDVITYIPTTKITVTTPAEGDSVAKNTICKFVANDGKTYIATAYVKGIISYDLDKATVTVEGITTIGTEVPADFDGSSIVLNTFDHPIATTAIMWNNNLSITLNASKNVILDGVGDIDYIQGTCNKWSYIGNTSYTNVSRTPLADITSGKIAYQLNQTIGEHVFYQNLNPVLYEIDKYPTTDSTHAKVISFGNGTYGNDSSIVVTPEITAIKTADDFMAMSPNGTYYLDADIILNGTYTTPFTGTLDGNGKTVTVSAPMFAEFNGTAKNLTINGEIKSTTDAGALAVTSTGGMIVENVTNNANITVTGAGKHAGGIFATNYCTDRISEYTDCVNNGDIYVNTSTAEKPRAGGFGAIANNVIFTRCINNGDIFSKGNLAMSAGILARGVYAKGTNTCEAYYCVNTGNITTEETYTTTGGSDAAGIFAYVGMNGNAGIYKVYGCLNTGDISAPYRVGGMCAYVYGSGTAYVDIEFCVNTGDLTYGRTSSSATSVVDYASYFVSYTNSTSTTICYNIGMGDIKRVDGALSSNPISFFACSSADATLYTIADNYIVDNGLITHYSYASAAETAHNVIEFSYALENGCVIRTNAEALKSGKICVELNNAAQGKEGYYFYQTIGTDNIPTVNNTSLWVVESNGTYVNSDKVESLTASGGCGGFVALGIVACVIPAAVVICSKKKED